MTDIDTMEAGAEMDAMVQKLVMGWKLHNIQWHPSSFIADAWEVVEKMRAMGWHAVLRGDSDLWTAIFDDGRRPLEAVANSAPLAVCRAALSIEDRNTNTAAPAGVDGERIG